MDAHELERIAKLLRNGSLQIVGDDLVKGPRIVAFESHVRSLRDSPLFNLSLASKELFHSNFLAWLSETYPDLIGPLFAKFTKGPCASCKGLKVSREKHNIDLTIDFPNKQSLFVENKVKSLASLEQLEEYSEQAKDKDRTSFLLLSLTHPRFVKSNNTFEVGEATWSFLSYSDLASLLEPTISSIASIDKYHGDILRDYLGFVRSLVAIAYHVSVDWDNEEAEFFPSKDQADILHEIRLHDLMDKIRYAQLAERIKETLEDEGCCVLAKEEFWAEKTK